MSVGWGNVLHGVAGGLSSGRGETSAWATSGVAGAGSGEAAGEGDGTGATAAGVGLGGTTGITAGAAGMAIGEAIATGGGDGATETTGDGLGVGVAEGESRNGRDTVGLSVRLTCSSSGISSTGGGADGIGISSHRPCNARDSTNQGRKHNRKGEGRVFQSSTQRLGEFRVVIAYRLDQGFTIEKNCKIGTCIVALAGQEK